MTATSPLDDAVAAILAAEFDGARRRYVASHPKPPGGEPEREHTMTSMNRDVTSDVFELTADLGGVDNFRDYLGKARQLVFAYICQRLEKTDKHVTFALDDDVYVVWFCKTLQNWKALISTTLPDGMYYEVTHNGDQHETYIDAYKKFDNVRVVD